MSYYRIHAHPVSARTAFLTDMPENHFRTAALPTRVSGLLFCSEPRNQCIDIGRPGRGWSPHSRCHACLRPAPHRTEAASFDTGEFGPAPVLPRISELRRASLPFWVSVFHRCFAVEWKGKTQLGSSAHARDARDGPSLSLREAPRKS